jgi:hypothetical protein
VTEQSFLGEQSSQTPRPFLTEEYCRFLNDTRTYLDQYRRSGTITKFNAFGLLYIVRECFRPAYAADLTNGGDIVRLIEDALRWYDEYLASLPKPEPEKKKRVRKRLPNQI